MTKIIDKNKARQGRSGWQVLVILVCALALALVVWWGVGIFGSAIQPEDPVGGAPAEQPGEVTEPAQPSQ
ncbi:hypothetical protein FY036_03625 [Mesorhizobium microcysteis]|uniref:Uncharacterized protein n=1 Tax=Neoaquamicrobium microcysteis TaxID=2682781 RepID=A0A5D4H7X0_9HYPH|nr:hypothetical protein [Mesorhizobium microcysteis]TYR34920.1 hypothetical protein FY036_03625 [Mesorhizobium microcysteis]